MTRTSIFAAALLLAGPLAPGPAFAIEPGSAACNSELARTQKKMQESLALVKSVENAPAPEKCPAYSRAGEMAEEIRESFARCHEGEPRNSAVRNADDVIEAIDKAFNKWCPPRPGMIRVRMIDVRRVTHDQLPKPLAAVHPCDDGLMYSTNERFDLGRLIMLGCPGNPNPSAEEMKKRNARAEVLQKEQAHVYVTRDKDGNAPKRLSFPILGPDGRETSTELVVAGRTSPGDRRDEISAYWEPAKEGVCRVHAVWRVADGKAALVFWGEAADCSQGSKTEFKAVLDQR